MSGRDTRNGWDELQSALFRATAPGNPPQKVLAADVRFSYGTGEYGLTLLLGGEADEVLAFRKHMDRFYNAGYGSQELFGTVWLSDGSWLVRAEYDGAEWWEHRTVPPIPTR